MTLEPVMAPLLPYTERKEVNAILLELAEEFADYLDSVVDDLLAFDEGMMAPAVILNWRERLGKAIGKINKAFPPETPIMDELGQQIGSQPNPMWREEREMELINLMDESYWELMQSSEVMPPRSEPWMSLMIYKGAFKKMQKLFIHDVKRAEKELGVPLIG